MIGLRPWRQKKSSLGVILDSEEEDMKVPAQILAYANREMNYDS